MNKSRSSMLLAVHVLCYSDLNWIQWFRMQFKHMLKLVKMMGVYYNTEYDRRRNEQAISWYCKFI